MVGYKVTDRGIGLLQAYLSGAEFIWIPGVNYDRLNKMALVLNKVMFDAEDEYFSIDLDYADEEDLLALKALEIEGCIERTLVPKLQRCFEFEEFKKSHPYRHYLSDPWDEIVSHYPEEGVG